MPTIQELRDERATIHHNATEILEVCDREKRSMTPDEDESFNRAMADVDRLGKSIEAREQHAALEDVEHRDLGITNPGNASDPKAEKAEQHRAAFEDYMRNGRSEMKPENKAVMTRDYWAAGSQSRAQGEVTGTSGGFLVPQGFMQKVTETMKWYASVADISENIETESGQDIPWPTNNDTSNTGRLLSENTQETSLDMSFGQATLGAWMYTSRIILVSQQLLQDSAIDVNAFVAKKAGQRLGRVVNQDFTTGTGVNQPQGFMTGATLGKTAAGVAAITYGELVDTLHSVDPAYRNGARWAMHDLTLAYIRKLTDGQSRPLWQPSIANGVPDTLLGYEYTINNFMDQMATTKKTVAFGNFSEGYVARSVRQPQLLRLEERYADYLQVGFILFARYDGLVQDTSAIKYLQQA